MVHSNTCIIAAVIKSDCKDPHTIITALIKSDYRDSNTIIAVVIV